MPEACPHCGAADGFVRNPPKREGEPDRRNCRACGNNIDTEDGEDE